MTTIEAQIKLLSWFSENNSFCLTEDLTKIKDIPKNNQERTEAAFGCALDSLEKGGLVKKYSKTLNIGKNTEIKNIWILESSLASVSQDIQCSTNVAIKISETVNNFLTLIDGNNDNKSDPSNLGEADLIGLLALVETLANRLKELEESKQK